MNPQNGKGSARRKGANDNAYAANYDRIFGGTTKCPFCGPTFIGQCTHGHAEPNEDHKQVMPQTIEAYKQLAQRDLELIEEQREEISKLKQRVNKLEQKVSKREKERNALQTLVTECTDCGELDSRLFNSYMESARES